MAQTNFTPILTYKSDTASAVPSAGNLTNSANGAELAVNTADKRLFTKDSGGSVVELGTNPSSLTLPNGTANGVVYANDSKVLTTGSALTFDGTNLSSTGGATFQGSPTGYSGGEVRLGSTTSDIQSSVSTQATGSPILFFDHRGTSNTGLFAWRNGSGGGSELMRLTSTGLGIGTSSPIDFAQYGYGPTVEAFGGRGGSFVTTSSSSTVRGVFAADSSGSVVNLKTVTNHALAFGVNDAEQMRLTSTGLGIGTSSPGAKLQVTAATATGTSGADGARFNAGGNVAINIGADSNTGYGWIQSANWGSGYINTAINPNGGNVGIGTSSPLQKLQVKGIIAAENGGIDGTYADQMYFMAAGYPGTQQHRIRGSTSAVAANNLFCFESSTSTAGVYNTNQLVLSGDSSVSFKNGAMKLDSSGNLGLGVTPIANTRLYVRTAAVTDTAYYADNGVNSGFTVKFASGLTSIGNDFNAPLAFLQNNAEQMRLTSTGLGIGTSSPNFKLDVITGPGASTFIGTTSSTLGTLYGALKFGSTAGSNAYIEKGAQIRAYAASGVDTAYLTFYTSDGTLYERMRLDSSGNLGLGVTPSAWGGYGLPVLELPSGGTIVSAGTSQNLGANWYYSGGSFLYKTTAAATYFQQASGAFKWYTAPSGTAGDAISFTQAMTLDASGNLIIGATSAAQALHVARGSGVSSFSTFRANGSTSGALYGQDSSNNAYCWNESNALLLFGTNNTERARIDSSGNLLIQNTGSAPGTPGSGGYLYVEGGALKYRGSSGTVTTLAAA